jgi:hypothetical protein
MASHATALLLLREGDREKLTRLEIISVWAAVQRVLSAVVAETPIGQLLQHASWSPGWRSPLALGGYRRASRRRQIVAQLGAWPRAKHDRYRCRGLREGMLNVDGRALPGLTE